MDKLQHLPGMRDLSQESWFKLKTAQDHVREHFYLHGYRVLETPVLEPTELYLRKSGGELAARMYSFTDPGGSEVSLRPEYTASIVRHYLEEDSPQRLPVRVQYSGPVLRYEGDGNVYRQFTQVGAELLGSFSPRADAEILSLSCTALSSLGLSGYRLEMGDFSVAYRLLESLGLSERAIAFILGSMAELKKGPEGLASVKERASQLGLLTTVSQQSPLSAAMEAMEENEARELLHGLLQWAEVGSLGQREPSELVERMLRKFRGSDDPARLEQGLEVAYGLARITGEPQDCFKKVGSLIESCGVETSMLDSLKQVIGLLEADQLQNATVILDFGLVRGLAYYTGIVFEIKHPALEDSLGGGGRYDGLAKALGSASDVPALGFAYTLERLLDAIEPGRDAQEHRAKGPDLTLVLATNGRGYTEAIRLAQELRGKGTPVEMEVCDMSLEDSLSYAKAIGIAEVIAVNGDGKSTTYQVKASPDGSRLEG